MLLLFVRNKIYNPGVASNGKPQRNAIQVCAFMTYEGLGKV
jgi:hypothetical protein